MSRAKESMRVLVTGAATGIGRACAELLSREGYYVLAADVDPAVLELGSEISGTGHVCDMGDPDQIVEMFKVVDRLYGPLMGLVNNAGIAIPSEFLDTTVADFQKVLSINLTGVFLATQLAAKMMIAEGAGGSIVNMSSINAVVSIPTVASYSASKGGVMQLTKASALALAPYGIRVNAVGPGSIDTAMMAGVNANRAALETAISRTPLRRMGTAAEVAETVAFLLSSKASYITGETIYVDGGRLALNYTV